MAKFHYCDLRGRRPGLRLFSAQVAVMDFGHKLIFRQVLSERQTFRIALYRIQFVSSITLLLRQQFNYARLDFHMILDTCHVLLEFLKGID